VKRALLAFSTARRRPPRQTSQRDSPRARSRQRSRTIGPLEELALAACSDPAGRNRTSPPWAVAVTSSMPVRATTSGRNAA
jgi:hypothetical protein